MVKVTITTASVLAKKSAEILKKAVIKKHGRQAEFDFKVDPLVIGGIKVVIGSKAIDMTVAGRLTQLRNQLMEKIS